MNITFLIGNGFDRNLGLNTTYSEFVKEYKKTKGATQTLKDFRSHIKDNEELWAAAEIALGQYTATFESGEGAAFSDCHTDICEELAKYLLRQQERLFFHIAPEKYSEAFAGLNKICEPFPEKERKTLKAIFTNHIKENWNYSFINFNYTNTLDKLVENAQNNPSYLSSHRNQNQVFNHSIDQVCHVHGTVEKDMVFGVNDDSQIAKNDIFDCENGDLYKNLLIKQQANAGYLEDTDAKAVAILNRSHIIYIYGMSIGETDKLWWNRVCKWLSGNSERHVIIQKYDMPPKGVLPIKYQIEERKVRNGLIHHCDLQDTQKKNIENRIHVTGHNIFESIHNTVLSSYKLFMPDITYMTKDIVDSQKTEAI